MPGFVIEYHRKTGAVTCDKYRDLYEATVERLRRDKLRTDMDVEIVSLSADSEETLRRSHSRYFVDAA